MSTRSNLSHRGFWGTSFRFLFIGLAAGFFGIIFGLWALNYPKDLFVQLTVPAVLKVLMACVLCIIAVFNLETWFSGIRRNAFLVRSKKEI